MNNARVRIAAGLCLCAQLLAAHPAVMGQPTREPRQGGTGANSEPLLPVIPHEANPSRWPQPDYFTEALRLTSLRKSDRAKVSKIAQAPGAAGPEYVVLPIQGQAFGFAPAFRAVLAAHLDHRLAELGIEAPRQTDLVDVYGPYARRLDADVMDDVARQFPRATILALHAGHDGGGKGFITLVATIGARQVVAHRSVELPDAGASAIRAVSAPLVDLLAEAGVASRHPVSAEPPGRPGCSAEAWRLADLANGRGGAELACRALITGTLMPELELLLANRSPLSAGKLAWLAQAYVEADALSAVPAMAAVRDLAWAQLRLGPPAGAAAPTAPVDDPVVGPLRRLLEAPQANAARPVRSGREAVERHVEDAARPLAGFVRTVFVERGSQDDPFHRADLCAIEHDYPAPIFRPSCPTGERRASAGRSASRSEAVLYQEWRLAASLKDLELRVRTLGQPGGLEQAMEGMPADVAKHPFVQQLRFAFRYAEATTGGFEAYLAQQRSIFEAYVQSTADLQRETLQLSIHSMSEQAWSNDPKVTGDARIKQLADDEYRLRTVLRYDRYATARDPARRWEPGAPASFLAPGPMWQVLRQIRDASDPASRQSVVQPGKPPLPGATRLFRLHDFSPERPTAIQLVTRLQLDPFDMEASVGRALSLLKGGTPIEEARKVIDSAPIGSRVEDRIGESHRWAKPAHAMFMSGELEESKRYYRRVVEIGTGSESDLQARMRLRLLDGDVRGARDAAADRLRRYGSDFARRDLAGLLFMTGQTELAWNTVLPSLPLSAEFELWTVALTGHRIAGLDLRGVRDWLSDPSLASARIEGPWITAQDAAGAYLHLSATLDRRPTDEDLAMLQKPELVPRHETARWAASALLVRMALGDGSDREKFEQVRKLMSRYSPDDNSFLLPLYAWVAWPATDGKDPDLEPIRGVALDWEFDWLLAKALLLARQGDVDQSLRYLRAARYELAALGMGQMADRPVPAPYQYALAAFLMHARTGHAAYRADALRFVRSQQVTFPYLAWPYAMEAALDLDPTRRTIAACRARRLDAESWFLKVAAVSPVPAACRGDRW